MSIATTGASVPNTQKAEQTLQTVKSDSITQLALRRFMRHRLAMISLGVLAVIVILALGADLFQRYPPNAISLGQASRPPSWEHWLGTDRVGRDVWSRLIHGARISLAVGLVSAAIALSVGILLGSFSGYHGGWVDMGIQRLTDIFMTFPSIILMLTVAVFIGPGVWNTILIIGIVSWMGVTRLVRAEFLAARERVYVEAAQSVGVRNNRIIFGHILPNALTPVLAQAAFAVGAAILTEAGLSFLGLGVPLPTSSWGNMLEPARELEVLRNTPWMWMAPAFMIVLTVLCVNFITDGLRDAFDPRTLL